MMTVRRFNSLLLLALLTVSGSISTKVVGRAGEDVTLPCKYDIKKHGPRAVFWNQVSLSRSGWVNQIISTDGSNVTTRASSRYQLLGRLEDGDVSLTILNTTEEDAGWYECRVEIAGWFNDETHHIDLTIEKVSGSSSREVVGRAGEDVTLPCKYNITSNGPTPVCWGRGSAPDFLCNNQIIYSDGYKVTTRASSKYQLLERLEDGDASLTILKTTKKDAGRYGCRVEIPGPFNDEIHHIDLTIEKTPSTSSTPTTETTEQTPQTEQTITTSGQVTITTSSTSINSEQQQRNKDKEEKKNTYIIILVCVLLVLVGLVTAGVTFSRRRWDQHKVPQQQQQQQQQQEPELMYSLIQFSSDPPAVELQNQGPAIENIYQSDGDGDAGGDGGGVYEVSP